MGSWTSMVRIGRRKSGYAAELLDQVEGILHVACRVIVGTFRRVKLVIVLTRSREGAHRKLMPEHVDDRLVIGVSGCRPV